MLLPLFPYLQKRGREEKERTVEKVTDWDIPFLYDNVIAIFFCTFKIKQKRKDRTKDGRLWVINLFWGNWTNDPAWHFLISSNNRYIIMDKINWHILSIGSHFFFWEMSFAFPNPSISILDTFLIFGEKSYKRNIPLF